ncbi:hypothetical protein [Reichenbachiella versicolor]|uniref:hypothetical protein n=1 Tax=Reichenbachiella versicolor TaxID=1821036 RepID=UPI000D6DF2EC|nr:hypothetical protein [Reichenbachiella versicolor]
MFQYEKEEEKEKNTSSTSQEELKKAARVNAEINESRKHLDPTGEKEVEEYLAEFGHTKESISAAAHAQRVAETEAKKANEKSPEQVQKEKEARREASKQAIERAGASKYYTKLKKDTIFRYGKRIPNLKLAFKDFESKMSREGLEVGTRGFVTALEADFVGLQWGAMIRGEEYGEYVGSASVLNREFEKKKVDAKNTQISKGVGAGSAANLKGDVLIIQQALHKLGLLADTDFASESEAVNNTTSPSVEKDSIQATIAAIEKFQREVLRWGTYDGNISGPGSGTLKAMHSEEIDYDHVQKMIKGFPDYEAKRKAKKEAEAKKKQELAKAEEARKEEAERIQCIKDEPTTDQHIQENFIEQYDSLDTFAKVLIDYVEHNPDLVIAILNSENVEDELSPKLLDHLTDAHLAAASDDLLCSLQDSLSRWYDWAFDRYENEKARIERFVAVEQNENLLESKQGEKRAEIAAEAVNNKNDKRKYRWNTADKKAGKGVDCSHFIREIDAVYHSEEAKKQKDKNGFLTPKELNKYCKTFSLERINEQDKYERGTQKMVAVLKEHGTFSDKLEDVRVGDYVFTGSGKQKDISTVSHVVIITKIEEVDGKKRYYFAQSGKAGAKWNEKTEEYEGGTESVSNKYHIRSNGGLWKKKDGTYKNYFKGGGRP